MSQHHELSPSKFPAWSQCPAFDSDPAERSDATAGTAQHAALASILSADDRLPLSLLPEQAQEAVRWAAGHIRGLAGTDGILSEHRLAYAAPDAFAPRGTSEVFFGTADAVILRGNLADLVDYKSGDDTRDYRPQLAGYALALFSMRARLKTIRCHVLYGRLLRADSWTLAEADAAGIVLPILAVRQDPGQRKPVTCDYCGFCAHRLTCAAVARQVATVAQATEQAELGTLLRRPADISSPAVIGQALALAKHATTWADAVRSRALELATAGTLIPGYRVQERRGPRELIDIPAAFKLTGLAPEQFLTACKVSIPRLSDAVAAARGMTKSQAAQELESQLSPVTREGSPSFSIVADRTAK